MNHLQGYFIHYLDNLKSLFNPLIAVLKQIKHPPLVFDVQN